MTGLDIADEDLLGAGDSVEAFGVLFERHHREMLGFFVRRTADSQVAADLTAEVFAAAFVARRRFRSHGAGSARAWLYGIARRQLGRYARRSRVSERYRKKLGMERTIVDDDASVRVEQLAELAELRGELQAAMTALPQSQIDAIRLRVIEELPYREVAVRLGCTEGAARVRVTRGLSRLAEVLA